jgi:heme-degrading monooxygenase HmoA
MYARVIQVPLQPGSIDQAIAHFGDSVGPALKELDGFKNSRFLTNPETNKGLMVTLWETEAHRKGAESSGFLQQVLKDMSAFFAGPPVVDYYEVNVQVA